jgi:polyisoprenoid-binding protein YceI
MYQRHASKVGFVGSKVTGSHEGGFEKFTATIVVKDGQLVPNGTSVEIDMDSTWSDSDRLTGHLKNADFFDVPTYPTSTFKTTNIEKGDAGYNITGNFNLHGVTKSISFPAEIQVI